MAFKNPFGITTLDDNTCSTIALQGTYYSDTRIRYPDKIAVVRCDRCGLCPLSCSIGMDDYDLCLPCANKYRTSELSVNVLEADLYTRHNITAESHEQINNQDADNIKYIVSDMQTSIVSAMYSYLDKLMSSTTPTFRLTKSETETLYGYCSIFSRIHEHREWSDNPGDRFIPPNKTKQSSNLTNDTDKPPLHDN